MSFRRPLAPLAGALAVCALAACGDPNEPRPQLRTIADTLSAFAISGTPVSAPTALNTLARAVVRADAAVEFDVVFDIDETGQALLYPGHQVGGTSKTGIQQVDRPFDEVRLAPELGYEETDPTPIDEGDVLVIKARPSGCFNSFRGQIYSKLVVDSINVPDRQVFFRLRVDPNCGFRDLTGGLPER
jgi:hypothetical protein